MKIRAQRTSELWTFGGKRTLMQIAPISKHEWLRAYFIGLEFISITSLLATRSYGDWMVLGARFQQLALVGAIATLLLLVSSIVFVFQKAKRRLAVSGFFVTALFVLGGILLPSGGIRF